MCVAILEKDESESFSKLRISFENGYDKRMLIANLIEQTRFTKKFNVVTNEGLFEVIYDGTGMGYEQIIVNGEVACRTTSYLWYVPEFEFDIGSLPAKVEVAVSVWLQIAHFNMIVAGVTLYSE